jgi:hyperosmotically inducible protein
MTQLQKKRKKRGSHETHPENYPARGTDSHVPWRLSGRLRPNPDGSVALSTDNTRTNQRDRNSNEATADQQKMNQSDRDITQQIRRSIEKDKSLSTYGHNVKVITQNGMVTLKGPVRSEEEKKAVEEKAAEVAGADKVTNQIDVQPKQ